MSAEIQIIPTDRPWMLDIWERLNTKAPNPCIVQPYCWGFKTVTFYARPYVVRPWHHLWWSGAREHYRGRLRAEKPGQHYEEYDRIEHELTWDSPIEHNGETFRCGGGTVVWRGKGLGWWMKFWARREQPRDDMRNL